MMMLKDLSCCQAKCSSRFSFRWNREANGRLWTWRWYGKHRCSCRRQSGCCRWCWVIFCTKRRPQPKQRPAKEDGCSNDVFSLSFQIESEVFNSNKLSKSKFIVFPEWSRRNRCRPADNGLGPDKGVQACCRS